MNKKAEDKQVPGLIDWYWINELIERKEYCQLSGIVQGIKDAEVLQYVIKLLCESLEEQDVE